jgi:hypothetical protein
MLKFNSSKLGEFRSIMTDLSKISPTVKMKISKTHLLLYTTDPSGKSSNTSVHALKTYNFTFDYFFDTKLDNDLQEEQVEINWIIKDVRILIKKMTFLDDSSDIKIKFKFKPRINKEEGDYVRLFICSDGKYKFNLTGDEPNTIKDISNDKLNEILDPNLAETDFTIFSSEFSSCKKLSLIEKDEIITIVLDNGNIVFKQSGWELLVGKKEITESKRISFNKKYLKSINPSSEEMLISIFPTFILWKEGNQKLMVSFEQSF